jgi:hypothetical protein
VKDITFLSTERKNHDAEKQIITDSLSNIVFAAAQHAFAVGSLRRLFKPKLSTHWHTANYPDKEWIQSHFSFRDRDTTLPGSTKTVIIPSMRRRAIRLLRIALHFLLTLPFLRWQQNHL